MIAAVALLATIELLRAAVDGLAPWWSPVLPVPAAFAAIWLYYAPQRAYWRFVAWRRRREV